jgi:hypothetical protein
MELLGHIKNRQILYTNIRTDQTWLNLLPADNWMVFTIADNADEGLLIEVANNCIEKLVSYVCCAGELCGLTEQIFDEVIVYRAIQEEEQTGKPYDYETSPMTTSHKNFSEGFWFATTVAYDCSKGTSKIVCIDFTIKGVKRQLTELVTKINNHWLPSDEETESPFYDDLHTSNG